MNSLKLYFFNIVMRLLPETRFFSLKALLLRWCGATVGRNVRICSSAVILGNGSLTIGDDVWIGEECFIRTSPNAGISIGSHCDLAPRVALVTGTHEIDRSGEHVAGRGYGKSIAINDGCWLCVRSTLLPGVSLAERTLVAAGAVVVKSVECKGTLVAGVPAVEKTRL